MRRVCLLSLVLLLLCPASAFADRLLPPNAGRPARVDSGLEDAPRCRGVTPQLQAIWQSAAARLGVDWSFLAAITKVESNYGCDLGPSSAGALGWTQFLPSTWKSWGTDADANGIADPNNAVDAVYATARYLRASGAPKNYRRAVFAYNHADWYVRRVLRLARQFRRLSPDQLTEMSGLAVQYSRLEDKLHGASEELERIQARRHTQAARLRFSRGALQGLQRRLGGASDRLQQAKARLDQATLDYIQTTLQIQGGAGNQWGDGQQLLGYIAGADPQDAVLVYISARSMMERQGEQLQELRGLADQASQAEEQLKDLTEARRQRLVLQKNLAQSLYDISVRRRQLLAGARRDLAAKAATVRRYARRYLAATGDAGSLNSSPLGSLVQGSVLWLGAWHWPVSGPVTSLFQYRCLDDCHFHEGIDIGAPAGRPIRATAAGVVSYAGWSGGYGNLVEVRHPGGWSSRYGHMSSIASRVGQHVKSGKMLGRVGCTGHCFGDHLHFELRREGRPLNPLRFLPRG